MFGKTTGGLLVPMLVAADGSLAVTGAGGIAAAVSIADGSDVAEGAKADAAVINPASSASEIALLKGLLTELLLLTADTGVAQTPGWAVAVVSGSVVAGAKSITIVASNDFTGTVGGAAFLPDTAHTWRAEQGHKLAALAYTRSAGTLYIGTVV